MLCGFKKEKVWSNSFIRIGALVKPWTNKQQPHTRMEYARKGIKSHTRVMMWCLSSSKWNLPDFYPRIKAKHFHQYVCPEGLCKDSKLFWNIGQLIDAYRLRKMNYDRKPMMERRSEGTWPPGQGTDPRASREWARSLSRARRRKLTKSVTLGRVPVECELCEAWRSRQWEGTRERSERTSRSPCFPSEAAVPIAILVGTPAHTPHTNNNSLKINHYHFI